MKPTTSFFLVLYDSQPNDEAKAIATDYFILFKCTICDDLLENKPTCIDTNSEEIRNILELHSLF